MCGCQVLCEDLNSYIVSKLLILVWSYEGIKGILIQGVWGTWAIGHMGNRGIGGNGVQGVWATGVWVTWAMRPMGE